MTGDEAREPEAGLPPAGWYDNPDDPGGGVERYWDGSSWTQRFRHGGGEERDNRSLNAVGLVGVAGVGIASALTRDGAEAESAANQIGYGFGVIVLVAIIALIRLLYVKVVAKDRPFWSPWILIVAAGVGMLAVVGNTNGAS